MALKLLFIVLTAGVLLVPPKAAASAGAQDFYQALGVERSATIKEIKAKHRQLVKELRPDINTDAETVAKFLKIQSAYEVLSDEGRRALYDRSLNDPEFTINFNSTGSDGLGEFQTFFTSTKNEGLFFSGQIGNHFIPIAFLKPNLTSLSVRDAIDQSERYKSWQRVLSLVANANHDRLAKLNYNQVVHVGGAVMTGVNGIKLAWAFHAIGVINVLAPAQGNSPWLGAAVVGASPLVWHALTYCATQGMMRVSRECLNSFDGHIVQAPSQSPLVNALAAYDFMAESVEKYLHYHFLAKRYTRMMRGWVLFFAKKNPLILKGWLIRHLQASSRLIGFDDVFLSLVKSKPSLWQGPLSELIVELEGFPELKGRAEGLKAQLESQSALTTLSYKARETSARLCELALANYTALTRKRD